MFPGTGPPSAGEPPEGRVGTGPEVAGPAGPLGLSELSPRSAGIALLLRNGFSVKKDDCRSPQIETSYSPRLHPSRTVHGPLIEMTLTPPPSSPMRRRSIAAPSKKTTSPKTLRGLGPP